MIKELKNPFSFQKKLDKAYELSPSDSISQKPPKKSSKKGEKAGKLEENRNKEDIETKSKEDLDKTDMILKKKLRPCFFKVAMKGEPQHKSRQAIAAELLHSGLKKKEVIKLLLAHNWNDRDKEETTYQVNQIAEGEVHEPHL